MPIEKSRARLLLVESDPWDAGLVQEALDELEERPHENLLGRPVDLFHAESIEEALTSLEHECYDLILLDLAVNGSRALHPYLQLREAAHSTPVIILTDQEEEPLAISAMREGAAGYLLKEDLDCLPLARTLRAALERQQGMLAREAHPGTDELTGLTSRSGFLYLGEMAIRLARRWAQPVKLLTVTLTSYAKMQDAFGAQARDMALLETAEMIRELFPDADLMARTGAQQFGVLSLCMPDVLTNSPRPDFERQIAQWVERRSGKAGIDRPVLSYETVEVDIDHTLEPNLAELLRQPAAMAAAMQE